MLGAEGVHVLEEEKGLRGCGQEACELWEEIALYGRLKGDPDGRYLRCNNVSKELESLRAMSLTESDNATKGSTPALKVCNGVAEGHCPIHDVLCKVMHEGLTRMEALWRV